jgi:hypothetical protein
MAPVALTSTGNSRAALMRPRAAAHKPAPAANKGALAARPIAEFETISVSGRCPFCFYLPAVKSTKNFSLRACVIKGLRLIL